MSEGTVIQGRMIGADEVALIRDLMHQHPKWGRTRLSEELCALWSWRAPTGRLKDMACRTLLLKLERAGRVVLPAPRRPANNAIRNRAARVVEHDTRPIVSDLQGLLPLSLRIVEPRSEPHALFNHLLQKYHYLGHRSTVGETMRYLVYDAQVRPVACMLFGSAAWALRARDEYIGWDRAQRAERLQWVTNNTRFLVMPWVRVPNLASHVLSLACNRLRNDWQAHYAHPVSAVETFVERDRFRGTCYQAANWIRLGRTLGRTRNDRDKTTKRPIKDVYFYPLTPHFRSELRAGVTAHMHSAHGAS